MEKKEYNYFKEMENMANSCFAAADTVFRMMKNYNKENKEKALKWVCNELEKAKNCQRECKKRLNKEFLPPMEREDLFEIVEKMEIILEEIKEGVVYFDVFPIQTIRKEAVEYYAVLKEICAEVVHISRCLTQFRHISWTQPAAERAKELEERGKIIYIQGIKKLCTQSHHPMEIFVWYEIFTQIRRCCWQAVMVAQTMEKSILKNS